MRVLSRKRARAERTYRQSRADYLETHPVCERCQKQPATELHHRTNRSQSTRALLDVDNFVALCGYCHRWVTLFPVAARAEGWSVPGWQYRQDADR